MSVIPQFLATLYRLGAGADPTPLSLIRGSAIAIAATLPGVAGTAVCLNGRDRTRVAVGVSDAQALVAEQWEYTVGAGPGFHAHHTGHPEFGDDIAQRWPAFHDALLSHTAFRAVHAVPIPSLRGAWSASLLVYYPSVSDALNVSRSDVTCLGAAIGFAVAGSAGELTTQLEPGPSINFLEPIGTRMGVSVAVGMVMEAHGLNPGDALDVLRAYSYAYDLTVDATAQRVASGQLKMKGL